MAPQPWNLGPPVQNFSALANLGSQFTSAYDSARKRAQEESDRELFAAAAQGGDLNKIGLSLLGRGRVQEGAALLSLGQKAQERDLERQWLGGNAPPLGAPATPVAPTGGSATGATRMPPAEIRAIIDRNVPEADREYAYRMAQKESSFNPSAVSPTGATGLFQFTGGTGRQYGLVDRAGDLRANPEANTQAFVRFTEDNRNTLRKALGREPTYGELAMAHQQGAQGALALITGQGDINPNNLRVNNADPNAPRSATARRIMAYYGYGDEQPAAAPVQAAQAPAGQRPVQSIQGDDPVRLRQEAEAYAQSNPEAARQLLARADAAERASGVQVAQAPADAPAPGAAPAQGFAVPAGENEFQQRSIMSDKGVQAAQRRLETAPTERTRAIAQTQLNLAIKDAEQRFSEGKAPEAVREWQWARRNGLTEAKSPVAYAKEKAEATRQDSAPTTRTIKQADGSEVIVQWNSETKNWDPLRAPAGGEAVRPTGTKLTEGQSKDLIYHSRGLQALEAFEPVSAAYADGVSRVAAQVPGGNYVVSEDFQKARQAGRNFLASVLRKDTGAAVTTSEEQLYGDIFLPAPGDKPGTLAQKAEARRQAIDAIRNGLGTAEVLALGKKLTSRQPGQDAPAGAPAPQSAPAAPAAAPAPARPAGGQPRTATNPNTGQRLMETPDGQWVPIDG